MTTKTFTPRYMFEPIGFLSAIMDEARWIQQVWGKGICLMSLKHCLHFTI
jgi:hypothetical protein